MHHLWNNDLRCIFSLLRLPAYAPLGTEIQLYINQGNKKYQLEVGDEAIIQSHADVTSWPSGRIYVSGLKKGSTLLTVKDEVNGQEVSLNIHVVDPFLVLRVGHLIPAVKADPATTGETLNTIRDGAKTFAAFELEELVILHRNAAQKFFVFKDQEALVNAVIERSGTYDLAFSKAGTQQLTLRYDGEEPVTLPLQVSSQLVTTALTAFSGSSLQAPLTLKAQWAPPSGRNGIHADSPIEYFDHFFRFRNDLTAYFKTTYPDVESVELLQDVHLWNDYYNYGLKIGDGVLK